MVCHNHNCTIANLTHLFWYGLCIHSQCISERSNLKSGDGPWSNHLAADVLSRDGCAVATWNLMISDDHKLSNAVPQDEAQGPLSGLGATGSHDGSTISFGTLVGLPMAQELQLLHKSPSRGYQGHWKSSLARWDPARPGIASKMDLFYWESRRKHAQLVVLKVFRGKTRLDVQNLVLMHTCTYT